MTNDLVFGPWRSTAVPVELFPLGSSQLEECLIAVKGYHDQGNSQKKEFNWGLACSFRESMTIMVGSVVEVGHAWCWNSS